MTNNTVFILYFAINFQIDNIGKRFKTIQNMCNYLDLLGGYKYELSLYNEAS